MPRAVGRGEAKASTEHEGERTPGCVSPRAEVGNAGIGRTGARGVVGDTGLEPVTSCMSSKCSNQLS